ncbi:hypothetical protein [Mycolicibacterium sp.]|uniref:hypothetical protein n=1 Tax=Mycolicibacterium sp. TaxID=2320850 RepID=UPI00355D25A6
MTVRDPRRLPADAATVRFVPTDPFDYDVYDAVGRWIFNHYPRYVWLDEAGIIAPHQGAPKAIRQLVVQGRKRSIGMLALHTRPREVDRALISNSAHVIAFPLVNSDDRRHLADLAGVGYRDLDDTMGQLDEFEFIWWDQRRATITVCPPI